ncbi:CrcB family protein [Corynebacterium felinum]|uniref:Fluoride-specific ion channel n=2 Tax=Corynebacterium felinum TaxID=131318 RepID=A0ABU2B511_9CORY|nr:CrcB family protein [Corynebacterium felinum]MDF5820333.1 CrcB family protein [Corynebacterium felinum]MDR7353700.1 CrcB protein [Corynebacterium felinum]WJY95879.1 camphor resistance protein CrcB [Corynebacterium felinum]
MSPAKLSFTHALLCGIGASGGALARTAIHFSLGDTPTSGMNTLLLINVAGCALFGALELRPAMHYLVVVGFLGGFTSLSTFVAFIVPAPAPLAVAYALSTATSCVLASMMGQAIDAENYPPPTPSTTPAHVRSDVR